MRYTLQCIIQKEKETADDVLSVRRTFGLSKRPPHIYTTIDPQFSTTKSEFRYRIVNSFDLWYVRCLRLLFFSIIVFGISLVGLDYTFPVQRIQSVKIL